MKHRWKTLLFKSLLWTDERGLLIAAKPNKLIVPSALQFTATRLLETELRVSYC
jgi:phage major head subunit gpT-like protein